MTAPSPSAQSTRSKNSTYALFRLGNLPDELPTRKHHKLLVWSPHGWTFKVQMVQRQHGHQPAHKHRVPVVLPARNWCLGVRVPIWRNMNTGTKWNNMHCLFWTNTHLRVSRSLLCYLYLYTSLVYGLSIGGYCVQCLPVLSVDITEKSFPDNNFWCLFVFTYLWLEWL